MIRSVLALLALLVVNGAAIAADAVPISGSDRVLNLIPRTDVILGAGETVQVSTAPDLDGVVQRIEVRATRDSTEHWAVVGLQNNSDEQIDRLLVARHHVLSGSGILDPDLGAARVAAITPSEGFPPQRVASPDADVFSVTLDPGATVTFVMELTTDRLPQLRLWEPAAYAESQNAYTLFKGIVVGISGLLAVFFLVTFVIKGQMMFASAAVLAWVVFAYILIDFAFLADVVTARLPSDAVLRAFAEAMLTLTLAAFLTSYLNIRSFKLRNTTALVFLIPAGLAAGWLAQFDPELTAGLARVGLGVVAFVGLGAILIASIRGHDRALMIIPTWLLLIAWMIAGGLTVSGDINNDFVQPALNGGIVLLVLLVGFTVMQHAFAGASISPTLAKDVERDVLALAGSGDMVWDWDVVRERITCSPEAEQRLGLEKGELQGNPDDWVAAIHPQDRDRFRATLDATVERRRGRITDIFRFRGVDGHFRWFRLRARPVIGANGEIIRCVGTLHDETEARTIEERLLHDSVYDNLTGLPNRSLFLDRIEMARMWSNETTAARLFVAVVNPDNFADINDEFGQSVGDSVLLTVARRLGRVCKRHDSVARLPGDSFGLLLYVDPGKLTELTDRVRETLRTPVPFADREISVIVSIGVAAMDLDADSAAEIVDNAELALRRAKRQGGDRVEIFDPLMRRLNMAGRSLARDLKRAMTENRIKLQFRPVVALESGTVVGYEAMPSWHHPLQGPLEWGELLAVASTENLAVELALSMLERCAETLGELQASDAQSLLLPLLSSEVLRSELVGDVKTATARHRLPPGALQLGVPEELVTTNPEFAVQLLSRLRDVGASTWIIDFARRTTALPHLDRLPLDGVRFDARLTHAARAGKREQLVQSLFSLARSLELVTMAAGVQDAADARQLSAMGAVLGVGPAFGRPVSAPQSGSAARKAVAHAAAAE